MACRVRSVSFSGAGFLESYHAGVAHLLTMRGALVTQDAPPVVFLGSSAGSVVAGSLLTGQPSDDIMAVPRFSLNLKENNSEPRYRDDR